VFKTRAVSEEIGGFATTLLASVERCSRCWTSQGAAAGCEHGSTLASSVVAEDVARGGTSAGSVRMIHRHESTAQGRHAGHLRREIEDACRSSGSGFLGG